MAKYNIYAVGYGIHPKTKEPIFGIKFPTWDEAKPYVVGVEGAKYKGFLTDEEADSWIAKIKEDVCPTIPSLEREIKQAQSTVVHSMVKEDDARIMKEITESYEFDPGFAFICGELGITPRAMSLHLQRQFVKQQEFIKNELPFN